MSDKNKKEFVPLWLSYEVYFEAFSDAEVGRLARAMITYKSSGVEPVFSGNERFIWPALRRDIDTANQKQENKSEQNRKNIKNRYETLRSSTNGYEQLRNDTNVYEELQTSTNGPNVNEKEKEKEKQGKENFSAAAVGAKDADLAMCVQCYEENIGVVPRYIGDKLLRWLKKLPPELICRIIGEAVAQNVRRWSYIEAILRRCDEENIRTVPAYEAEIESKHKKDPPTDETQYNGNSPNFSAMTQEELEAYCYG